MGSSILTSLHGWHQLPWLYSFILFSSLLYATMVTGTDQISYQDHCASMVPESTPNDIPEFSILPFPNLQNGYYDGGDRILNPESSEYASNERKTLLFRTESVFGTHDEGVFKVDGSLIFYSWYLNSMEQDTTYARSVFSRGSSYGDGGLSFSLKGFWSRSAGKLCMVGSGSSYSREGNILRLIAVLKLNGVRSSNNITSLVSGTLTSLDSADQSSYFDPISLLIFPQINYQYTKASKESIGKEFSGEINIPAKKYSLNLKLSTTICSILSWRDKSFDLEYASDCNSTKSCNPFGDALGYLPRVMSMNTIQCSVDGQSMRVLMEFPNSSHVSYYRPFKPSATFVGEGTWDLKKNRLSVVACRILTADGSLDSHVVEDCSIRLTLRFPAIWSIRNITSMLGYIWTKKTASTSGYFDRIVFRGSDNDMPRIPGLKYEYTVVDKITNKTCSSLTKKPIGKGEGKYPDGNSCEMSFDMSFKSSGQETGRGSSVQISVGDQISQRSDSFMASSSSRPVSSGVEAKNNSRPLNISYKISLRGHYSHQLDGVKSLFNTSSSVNRRVEIFAEGIYDPQTGGLCMVGCRYVSLNNQTLKKDTMDCEVLVNLQFPPLNAKQNEARIRGSITSSRKKSDPLYFEPLSVSSIAYYSVIERQSLWRMDLEILMALISNTLACVFLVFQILYVKKHPGVLAFISLLMLAILTLGHMIVLVLNFEALFFRGQDRQSVFLGSGGWLEVHEVIIRVVTMVAFLLQVRLLQLSWSRRMGDNNHKALWAAEKKTLFVSLPFYLAGAIITLFVSWRKHDIGFVTQYYSSFDEHHHSLWRDLRSYAGFILDGFLFPQILLNVFYNSKENALSRFFYIGLTFVRLVPHAYDLYRAHNYVEEFDGSYLYANPAADFYSTGWDVTIPLVGMLFAAIIHFQQRFGGRFFLPRRFRELEVAYEKLPVASEE